MSRSDFEDFAGKWKKMNHSGYEEFIAKNPGLASDKDDIVLDYTLADDGFTCVVHIDGAHAVTANYKYSGVAENKLGEVKYTIETSVGSAMSRMPGKNISNIYKKEDGSVLKTQMITFHFTTPARMIVEEAANDVAMVTVFEKQE